MKVVVTVDKSAVVDLRYKLYSVLGTVKKVTAQSSYSAIKEAELMLHKAIGMYEVLSTLELIDNINVSYDDIVRMETKISDILSDKQRRKMIIRH